MDWFGSLTLYVSVIVSRCDGNCVDINLWPLYAWDTDRFMIPSLEIGDLNQSKTDVSEVEASKHPSPKVNRKNPTLFIT